MLVPHSDFVEGPQPMEGAQAESVSTVDSQAVDDPPSARFTWVIENFSRLNTKKLYSDVFLVGGYKWRILIFPKGNNVDHLSMYLDVADSTNLPYGWSRYARFSLAVVNQILIKYSIRKEEEKNFGLCDRLTHVYHFMKDTTQNQFVQNFGEPFFLVIREGETLGNVKVHIQKKLQVPDEEFSKWKVALLSLGRPEYLQDSDVVSSCFQQRDVYGAWEWEQYLGLEHTDNAPKRSYVANQNRHTYEKPVKIHN